MAIADRQGGRPTPPFLFGPAESLQVEAVPVVELDAFRFQQALLEGVAAIAGEGVGHLALRVDDAMPGNIGCRVEVLEYVADKAGAPWQAGHRGDLAIGGNPALGNAADYSANRRGGFVASVWGSRSNLRFGGIGRFRPIPVVRRIRIAWLYHGPAFSDILGPPFVSRERQWELDLLLRLPSCGKHNAPAARHQGE